MGLVATIVVGLIAGLLASWIMKAKTGILVDLILGIVGAVVGGWITSLLMGVDLVSGVNLTSIVVAVLGAIAASKLGPEGGRVILLGARAGVDNAEAFTAGYREAMLVGAAFTVVGAFVSLIRERRRSRDAVRL